jgi:hypothetical protein
MDFLYLTTDELKCWIRIEVNRDPQPCLKEMSRKKVGKKRLSDVGLGSN